MPSHRDCDIYIINLYAMMYDELGYRLHWELQRYYHGYITLEKGSVKITMILFQGIHTYVHTYIHTYIHT